MKDKSYKKITINDIIEWCKENNEVEWLKAKSAETETVKRYPLILDFVDEKNVKHYKADKTKPPKLEQQRISSMSLKKAFCEKFFPDKLPVSKPKKPTFHDIISAL